MKTKISPFSAVEFFFLRAKVEGLSKSRTQNYEIVIKGFSRFLGVKKR